jgi:hypothetical protein
LKAQVMATHVANAAGEEVDHAMQSIRQGDRFVDKIPGIRSGTVNLSQLGANLQHGGGRVHNRGGSGSSGSSGQPNGGRPRFNPQLQSRVFGARTNTSRKFHPHWSVLANPVEESAPVGTPYIAGNQNHRSQIPVMGGTRQSAFHNVEAGPPYQTSPAVRQSAAGNVNTRNMNFGRSGGAPKRTAMGNIGHLVR